MEIGNASARTTCAGNDFPAGTVTVGPFVVKPSRPRTARRKFAASAGRWKPTRSAPRSPRRISSRHGSWRSEDHTSELQSRFDLVCRLLLEKKKRKRLDPIRVITQ